MPAFSRATVDGEPLDLPPAAREAVREFARSVPYDVIRRRGERDSSRWVTGRGAELVVEALLDGGPAGPVCLSTPLRGEYDVEGVALSVPVVLSADGVDRIEEWALADEEYRGLGAAAAAVRDRT